MVIKMKSVEYFWTVGDSFDDELQIFPQCKVSYQERGRERERDLKKKDMTMFYLVSLRYSLYQYFSRNDSLPGEGLSVVERHQNTNKRMD